MATPTVPVAPEPNPAARSRMGCFWRVARGFGVLIASMIVLILLAQLALTVYGGRKLEAELARIRADGDTLSLMELAPPAVPQAQNAAPLYAQAAQMVKKAAPKADTVLIPYLSLDSNERARVSPQAVQSTLSAVAPALRLARRAAALPAAQFPVRWDSVDEARFNHYEALRKLSRLLIAQANWDAAHGNAENATANLVAALRMAHHIENEPTLIGQLVEYAIVAIAIRGAEEVMGRVKLNASQRVRLDQALSRFDLKEGMIHAMKGERAFGAGYFNKFQNDPKERSQTLIDSEPPGGSNRRWTFLTLGHGLLQLDEAWYLDYMKNQIDRLETSGRLPGDEPSVPRYAIVSGIIAGVFSKAGVRRLEATARLGLGRWAMALQAFHGQTGVYPQTLMKVKPVGMGAPRLPLDPFTEMPYHYRREGSGFLLWSVGANRHDDDGKGRFNRTQRSKNESLDDLAWRSAH